MYLDGQRVSSVSGPSTQLRSRSRSRGHPRLSLDVGIGAAIISGSRLRLTSAVPGCREGKQRGEDRDQSQQTADATIVRAGEIAAGHGRLVGSSDVSDSSVHCANVSMRSRECNIVRGIA